MADQIAAAMATRKQPDLAKAYVAFWGEVPNVVKNAQNPHLKNNYANLEATMAVVKPVLSKHGLALLVMPGVVQGGNVAITTKLVHETGQYWDFTTEVPLGETLDKKTGKVKPPTPQAMGSCISYGRRYIVQAISGMAAVDDDGEAASQSVAEPEAESPGEEAAPADDDAVARLTGAIKAISTKKGTGYAGIVTLEGLKAEVQAAGDAELGRLYMAKRSELKALK